jgi:hypothetical protein
MLSEVFYTFLITTVSGLILACLGVLFKSKCDMVSCCGISIHRNIEAEERIEGKTHSNINMESKI